MIASAQASDHASELPRLEALLEAFRLALQSLHDRTPAAPEEGSCDDLDEELDYSTRVRSVLRCILVDYIEPALRDLRRLASDQPVS